MLKRRDSYSTQIKIWKSLLLKTKHSGWKQNTLAESKTLLLKHMKNLFTVAETQIAETTLAEIEIYANLQKLKHTSKNWNLR